MWGASSMLARFCGGTAGSAVGAAADAGLQGCEADESRFRPNSHLRTGAHLTTGIQVLAST